MNNIFTTNKILQRSDKENLLNQKGIAVWLTGLSGAGKTTIAVALEKTLHSKGKLTQVLDGDNIRAGINNNLGFSEEDRIENIRRIAEIAKLFVNNGIITICCFISPTEKMRSLAKDIIGKKDFVEVYINTPLEICEKRDVKGLYAKARKGEIKDFTGIDSPFEEPKNASLNLKTSEMSVEESVAEILRYINRIKK
ncbi:MAG: Adenylyl-sulfate kinase [Bacteroidetes bacterium]|jgi:adenylylsulfate kinase|nr:Adenylyl-sulfate kinase [Bacteroidota bacterium]